MIHAIEFRKFVSAKDLPILKENLERHGGIIVQYQKVFSLVLFSLRTTHWVWIPRYQSRRSVGFKFAVMSFILGMWSFPGFFYTPGVVLNDLLGGAEVTGLVAATSFQERHQSPQEAMKELKKTEDREGYIFILMVIVFFFGLIPLLIFI